MHAISPWTGSSELDQIIDQMEMLFGMPLPVTPGLEKGLSSSYGTIPAQVFRTKDAISSD